MTAGFIVSMETHAPSLRQRLDERQDAAQFFGLVDRRRTGARRFAADVDDGRPVREHPPRVRERCIAVEPPAVGERIRR